MIAGADIFSLVVGAIYSFAAPIAAYFVARRRVALKWRDVALGVLGALIFRALARFAGVLLHDVWPRGISWHVGVAFYSLTVGALIYGAVCFILLRLAASRSAAWAPAVAYGIGFGGCYDILTFGQFQLHSLRFALANYEGAESARLRWNTASERFIDNAFSYGIPAGVTAVAVLLISIGISMLIWRGLREGNWRWIGGAILLDASLKLPLVLLDAFGLPVAARDYYPFIGLVIILSFAFAAPQMQWLFDAARFQDADRDSLRPAALYARLLSAWREQRSTRASHDFD